MARQVTYKFSGFEPEVSFTLLDDEEPECTERTWEEVEHSLKVWMSHTTSTGDYFFAQGRPDREPALTGTQASPLSAKTKLLANLGWGSMVYCGAKFFAVNYGPDNTEPVAAPGPIVARADDLDLVYEVGRYVWEKQLQSELVTGVVRRKEQ